MKKLIILIFILTVANSMRAQSLTYNYETALGVKVWGYAETGISFKHFVKPNDAVEGIGYFWYHGVRFTGLYEFHFDMGVEGLKWYVGPGAHLGFYNNNYRDQYVNSGNGGSMIGIDGVIGLDYKFDKTPINLSLDWQPSIEFGTFNGFQGGWGGFAIRYTFK